MKKALLSAAFAAIFAFLPQAWAQRHDDLHGGDHAGPPHMGGGAPHAAPPHATPSRDNRGHGGPDHGTPTPAPNRGPTPGSAPDRSDHNHGNQGHGDQGRPGSFDRRPGRGPQGPAPHAPNFGRSGGNFDAYHRNFNAPHRFYAQAYNRPGGWYAHRWTFGERLPPAFFARDYWLPDYTAYDLEAPPYGTVWVRYGNDALLVDQETGEVIQVEYDVFY